MGVIEFKTRKLPDCCNFKIDEDGKKVHEEDCPDAILRDAMIVLVCIILAVTIVGWAIWYQVYGLATH